jgi:hypothetical protein
VWRYLNNGDKVRVSKRTGRIIPVPDEAYSTIDYVKKSLYTRKLGLILFNKKF